MMSRGPRKAPAPVRPAEPHDAIRTRSRETARDVVQDPTAGRSAGTERNRELDPTRAPEHADRPGRR